MVIRNNLRDQFNSQSVRYRHLTQTMSGQHKFNQGCQRDTGLVIEVRTLGVLDEIIE